MTCPPNNTIFVILFSYFRSSGYDEGYLAGLAASQANSKNTPESETATKKSNWDKLWSTTNKISTIMFLVVGVIVISQV